MNRIEITRTIAPLAATALLAAGLLRAGLAQAHERRVYVDNIGRSTIHAVHVASVGSPNWGPDLLGGGVVPAGDIAELEPRLLDGHCHYDVLIAYASGREITMWEVSLFEGTTIVASEDAAIVT